MGCYICAPQMDMPVRNPQFSLFPSLFPSCPSKFATPRIHPIELTHCLPNRSPLGNKQIPPNHTRLHRNSKQAKQRRQHAAALGGAERPFGDGAKIVGIGR
jgi:hypothetical protein